MAEQDESSVLFNLRELMTLEEDRIKGEEEARRQQEEDARRAKEEAERRRQEEEAAQARAAEEARLAEIQKARDEEERREQAYREAEARAKYEAEQAAKLQEQQQMLTHQRHMEELRNKEGKGRRKLIFIASACVALVCLLGSVAAYIGIIKPQQEAETRIAREAQLRAEQQAEENRRLAEQAKATAAEIGRLQEKIEDARISGQKEGMAELRTKLRREEAKARQVSRKRKQVRQRKEIGGDGSDDPIGGLEGL